MDVRLLAVAAVAVLLGACGGNGGDAGADGHDHDHGQDEAAGFAFGSPGDPAAATRTVEVTADDPYAFDPRDLEVEPGETVTFAVTNAGERLHEFVLGDAEYQDGHGAEMASGEMHHEGNAVTVEPGETEELTWTFPDEGEVLYGCHVAGHYQYGMVGAIRITA